MGDVAVTAEAVEERAEVAAGTGFLGGPYVWGLIALAVIILFLILNQMNGRRGNDDQRAHDGERQERLGRGRGPHLLVDFLRETLR